MTDINVARYQFARIVEEIEVSTGFWKQIKLEAFTDYLTKRREQSINDKNKIVGLLNWLTNNRSNLSQGAHEVCGYINNEIIAQCINEYYSAVNT